MKKEIKAEGVPCAIGPYSAGVEVDGLLFLSGQLPVDARTGEMPEGVEAQTKASLDNVLALLRAAGRSLENVVRATVYLTDMDDFDKMNEVYGAVFEKPYPARTCVEVRRLPKEAKVEIEVMAI